MKIRDMLYYYTINEINILFTGFTAQLVVGLPSML